MIILFTFAKNDPINMKKTQIIDTIVILENASMSIIIDIKASTKNLSKIKELTKFTSTLENLEYIY